MKIHFALILASALLPVACGTQSNANNSGKAAQGAISSEDQAANDLYLNDVIDSAAKDTVVTTTATPPVEETKADTTEERLTQMVASVMKRLDADSNGILTLEEYLVAPEKRAEEKELSGDELAKINDKMAAEFAQFSGEDKCLSADELKALLKSTAPRVGQHRKDEFPGQQAKRIQKSASEIIKEFDKDGDGKLNVAELEALQAAKKAEMDEFRGSRGRGSRGDGSLKPEDCDDKSRGDDSDDDEDDAGSLSESQAESQSRESSRSRP